MSNRVKVSDNFYLDEYIPKSLYLKYEKQPHKLMWLLDLKLINVDQYLRNRFGPMTINNWWNGGNRQWSGLRIPKSSYYSLTSQHSYGRASDKIPHNVSVDEIITHIKKSESILMPLGLRGVEMGVSWLHTDVRMNDTVIYFKA